MHCTYAKLCVAYFVLFHTVTGTLRVTPIDHLDESVTFVDVDDASLDHTELSEEPTQVCLGRSNTPNE